MGEALLVKAVDGGLAASGGAGKELYYFTINTTYTIPKTGNYRVTCIGGGGGYNANWILDFGYGNYSTQNTRTNAMVIPGGSSGYWNTVEITLAAGTSYEISIGEGAGEDDSGDDTDLQGGTSAFGNICSALGGATSGYAGDYVHGGGNHRKYQIDWLNWRSNGAFRAYVNTDCSNDYNALKNASTSGIIGVGGCLYIKGANVTNIATSGYERTTYGHGANINEFKESRYSDSNSNCNKTYIKQWLNPTCAYAPGHNGCVIVEFIN